MSKISQHYSSIKILTGSDLSKRRIPMMEMTSEANGPTLWLTGCMHGDEIGGTVVIHEVFKRLKKHLIKGSVKAFPLINPFGFESISRNITYSKEDLNRSFPGNAEGSLAQRIAAIVFNKIVETKPDLVIDLHNDWKRSIPYALTELSGIQHIDDLVLNFSNQSGLVQIEDTDKIHSSLTYNLMQAQIPALVLELGESYVINEQNIEVGIKAIWNLLVSLGMVSSSERPFRFQMPDQLHHRMLQYSALPFSSTSGIVRFFRRPGEWVEKGQKIAKVCNAYGKQIETINALADGIILGQTDTALAFPGSPVMAFGLLPDK
jgi:predicted deacylase